MRECGEFAAKELPQFRITYRHSYGFEARILAVFDRKAAERYDLFIRMRSTARRIRSETPKSRRPMFQHFRLPDEGIPFWSVPALR
jgi:hypothetical protein